MARVLVTGGAGFIGSHTVERLVTHGHAVTIIDNLSTGTRRNLCAAADSVELVEADVRDAERVQAVAAAGRYDAVIHLAAWASVEASMKHPVETHAINVGGSLHVLEAARRTGIPRVVLASSASVYGRAPSLPSSETELPRPASPYAAHKAAVELLGAAYREAFGLQTVVLRYFNVFGARQPADSPYSGFVAIAAERLLTNAPLTIHGDGEQTRDFIHVQDVAEVNARAATGPDAGGDPINVARGHQVTILSLVATLQSVLRVDPTLRFAPERPGDIRHSCADITRLRDRLRYEPHVTLEEGLRDVVQGMSRHR